MKMDWNGDLHQAMPLQKEFAAANWTSDKTRIIRFD